MAEVAQDPDGLDGKLVSLNAEPKQLTIFADWDGDKLVIRDESRTLETAEVLKV
jgi:hypothetical protein